MLSKKELIKKFQKDPEKYWKVRLFDELGFKRKQCKNCGKFFWTLTEQEICNDSTCRPYDFIGNPPTKKSFDYFETWNAIRDFFVKNDHVEIKRYPVVCRWFKPLYFTAAGIVDFYRETNGKFTFEFPATNVILTQPCIRFNDISNTGINGRSYTTFLMIQQSSSYDGKNGYWKDRCIELDFELLTKIFGIKPEEIVFIEDVWVGSGAFGYSLEYHVRGLELGNAVFTEFMGTPSKYRIMEKKVIDMGGGHERFTWISNGTPTSYDCVFGEVLKKLIRATGLNYDQKLLGPYFKSIGSLNLDDVKDLGKEKEKIVEKLGLTKEIKNLIEEIEAIYAIADHARTLLFAISDSALPSNTAGGYNLRVVFRRIMGFLDRFKWNLYVPEICEWHAKYLKRLFPELMENLEDIKNILDVEKIKYENTKQKAKQIISKIIGEEITEKKLLRLYDSQGISPEMIKEEAKKVGKEIKIPEDFYTKITQLHEKEEESKVVEKFIIDQGIPPTEELFYKDQRMTRFKAKVLKIIDGKYVVLDKTCFYPRSGGQEPDKGYINNCEVVDVEKQGSYIVHHLKTVKFGEGEEVEGEIDWDRRFQLMQHHTGAHIINAAARRILGNHVNQAGAFKDVDRARLDITHYRNLNEEEIEKIEEEANKIINERIPVRSFFLPRDEAEKEYGMRIYQGGAVPSKTLRIIEIPEVDVEACGGTHVANTYELEKLIITKTSKISDGVVRIEYKAGRAALNEFKKEKSILKEIAELLGVEICEIPSMAEDLFLKWKTARKAVRKKRKINVEELKLGKPKREELNEAEILKKTAKILKTQPEHVNKTIRRFLRELEEYKRMLSDKDDSA